MASKKHKPQSLQKRLWRLGYARSSFDHVYNTRLYFADAHLGGVAHLLSARGSYLHAPARHLSVLFTGLVSSGSDMILRISAKVSGRGPYCRLRARIRALAQFEIWCGRIYSKGKPDSSARACKRSCRFFSSVSRCLPTIFSALVKYRA